MSFPSRPEDDGLVLRAPIAAEIPRLLELNNAAAPKVNRLSGPDLDWLVERAAPCWLFEARGTIAGFLLALEPGHDYLSANYRWFAARFADFAYIDRVVVDAGLRGRGIGAAAYAELIRHVAGRRLCAEVNLEPPNPGSLRFHLRLGFRPIGRQRTTGGTVEVQMLERPAT